MWEFFSGNWRRNELVYQLSFIIEPKKVKILWVTYDEGHEVSFINFFALYAAKNWFLKIMNTLALKC